MESFNFYLNAENEEQAMDWKYLMEWLSQLGLTPEQIYQLVNDKVSRYPQLAPHDAVLQLEFPFSQV